MTQVAFLAFVLAVAATIVATMTWRLPRATAVAASLALLAWLGWVGVVSATGLVRGGVGGPPGPLLLFGPVALFLVVAAWSPGARRLAEQVPLWLLLGLQAFRVGVELFLHQLWAEGIVPRMLTYAGANLDIWVGASAPLAAWLAMRGGGGRRLALAWNWLGLLALGNVVLRSVLTAPGPLNLLAAEVPNLAVATFPYTFIAGFLAPLAVTLHILSIRRLRIAGEKPHLRLG